MPENPNKDLKPQRLVVIESPFRGENNEQSVRFTQYLGDAVKDCLDLGECPFASHGFYTRWLDDNDPAQRRQGILCGYAWMANADLVAVYFDLGISEGMRWAIEHAARNAYRLEFRSLAKWRK